MLGFLLTSILLCVCEYVVNESAVDLSLPYTGWIARWLRGIQTADKAQIRKSEQFASTTRPQRLPANWEPL